jgi:tRNA(Ile2) C34 agmatinyltransferase TiaS
MRKVTFFALSCVAIAIVVYGLVMASLPNAQFAAFNGDPLRSKVVTPCPKCNAWAVHEAGKRFYCSECKESFDQADRHKIKHPHEGDRLGDHFFDLPVVNDVR